MKFRDLLRRDAEPETLRLDDFSQLLSKRGETLDLDVLKTTERLAKNLQGESFSWIEDVLALPLPNTLKIVALHVGRTRNQTVYLDSELRRAARTMIEKPVFYGTSHKPEDKRTIGCIQWAEYEDDRLECIAIVDPEIYDLVNSGEIQKCSVETRYIYPVQVDGIRVHGVLFDGLLLVPRGVEVGDTETSVTTRLFETLGGER